MTMMTIWRTMKNMIKNISILGQEYEVNTACDELNKTAKDGLCYEYDKRIEVRPSEFMLNDADSKELKEKRYEEVVRHESVHAFFSESGLDNYSMDETLVNWLAMQIPKINKAVDEVMKAHKNEEILKKSPEQYKNNKEKHNNPIFFGEPLVMDRAKKEGMSVEIKYDPPLPTRNSGTKKENKKKNKRRCGFKTASDVFKEEAEKWIKNKFGD